MLKKRKNSSSVSLSLETPSLKISKTNRNGLDIKDIEKLLAYDFFENLGSGMDISTVLLAIASLLEEISGLENFLSRKMEEISSENTSESFLGIPCNRERKITSQFLLGESETIRSFLEEVGVDISKEIESACGDLKSNNKYFLIPMVEYMQLKNNTKKRKKPSIQIEDSVLTRDKNREASNTKKKIKKQKLQRK